MVWQAALALALASGPAATPINLVCTGSVGKDKEIGTIGSLLAGQTTVQRVESADAVLFTIQPDGGEAKLPKPMQSSYKEPVRENWFRLIEVKQDQDEIAGKIRLHGMYKPKFRLNRLTGQVSIEGSIANFSGTCEPYDPATVQRKF